MKIEDVLMLSGDLFLPKPLLRVMRTYIIGGPKSLFYIWVWSLMHIVLGFVVAAFLYPREDAYWVGFWFHTAWEFWQIIVRNTEWNLRGAIDTVVDTGLFMGGMWLFSCLFTGNKHE
jgi:hypothetical protein